MTEVNLTEVSTVRCFGGHQKVFSHNSKELSCKMNFAVYLPPQSADAKVPAIFWLSGLTCTEQNFIQKAGAQRYAAEKGVIIVAPDTSPRGCNIAGEDDSWDFGTGAGFYLDATKAPFDKNYNMYSYITKELTELVKESFPVQEDSLSIMGHSMGGHGAFVCALKNPGLFKSASAFSPICNPSNCAWGRKAFEGYLGPQEGGSWAEWDSTELVKKYNGPPLQLYIDQGSADEFLKSEQLLPSNLVKSCQESSMQIVYNLRDGYDHSYFFISSFIGEHIARHADNF